MLQLATKADRGAVNLLAQQVHDLHMGWRPDLFCETEEYYSAEAFDTHLKNRELYVAKLEGNVVGYVVLLIRNVCVPGMVSQRVMAISELCVHEACRGHGIGSQMMTDIRALAKAFRCTDLKLNVYPENEDAIRFYEANGFRIQTIGMEAPL